MKLEAKIRFDGMEYDAQNKRYILNEKVALQPIANQMFEDVHMGVRVIDLKDSGRPHDIQSGMLPFVAQKHGFEFEPTRRGAIKGNVFILSILSGFAVMIGFSIKGPIQDTATRVITGIGAGIATWIVPPVITAFAVSGMDDGYDYVIRKAS